MTDNKSSPSSAPAPEMVRYRVVKKVFWNGTLHDPASMPDPHIVAPKGIKSAALKDPNAPPEPARPIMSPLAGQAVQPPASLASAQRIADLEAQLATSAAAVKALQNTLDDERKSIADRVVSFDAVIAELEAQLAAVAKPAQAKK